MTRERLWWHKETADFRPYPPNAPARFGSGPMIIGDIEPYRNVAVDGAVIGGRRQHRDMLRAHGLIEVGNDRLPPRREPPAAERIADIGRSLKDSFEHAQAGTLPPVALDTSGLGLPDRIET